jgi:hypothetical protein
VPSAARATFKPRAVEELIDFYLHRPVAAVVVRGLARTRVTPDQVTFASGVLAIVAGLLMGAAGGAAWLMGAAAAALFASIVLDCADGQLARLRRQSSLAGRALDGFVDVASVAAAMIGQLAWLLQTDHDLWLLMLVGWPAAFSLRWHAHAYDHEKNLYLGNTEAPGSSEVPWYPSLEDIERERQEHARAGRWFSALLCRAFGSFTEYQRRGARRTRVVTRTPEERSAYARKFGGHIRAWTFNGLGTHLFVFTVTTALAPVWPSAPLAAWLIVLGPMNLLGWVLVVREPRLLAGYEREVLRPAT